MHQIERATNAFFGIGIAGCVVKIAANTGLPRHWQPPNPPIHIPDRVDTIVGILASFGQPSGIKQIITIGRRACRPLLN